MRTVTCLLLLVVATRSQDMRRAGPHVDVTAHIARVPAEVKLPDRIARKDLAGWLKKLEVVTAPKLRCRNGQRSSVRLLEQVAYVADFKLMTTPRGVIADPVIKQLPHGVRLEVRPFPVGDDFRLAIDARVSTVKLPMPIAKLALPTGATGEIQLPEARESRVMTSIVVQPGHAAVIRIGQDRVAIMMAKRVR